MKRKKIVPHQRCVAVRHRQMVYTQLNRHRDTHALKEPQSHLIIYHIQTLNVAA